MNGWQSFKGTILERSIERWKNCDPKEMALMHTSSIEQAFSDASDDVTFLSEENQKLKAEIEKLKQDHQAEIEDAWEEGYNCRIYA